MKNTNPYSCKIPYNNVLIELPAAVNDHIDIKGGSKLYVDTTFNPANHATVRGKVVSVCARFKDPHQTYGWQPHIEVTPGDEVIFDYFQMLNRMGTLVHRFIEHPVDMYLEWEDKYYVFIDYHELWAKIPLYPLNGYVIFEPHYTETKFMEYTKKEMANTGTVVAIGKPNISYSDRRFSDNVDLSVGDDFVYKNGMYRKLEYDLHATENKNLHLVQRRHIMAKI